MLVPPVAHRPQARIEIVALHQLHTVRHRPRGNQKWHNQGERVQVIAQQGDDAQSPGCRENNPEQRQQDTVQTSEIDDQQTDQMSAV